MYSASLYSQGTWTRLAPHLPMLFGLCAMDTACPFCRGPSSIGGGGGTGAVPSPPPPPNSCPPLLRVVKNEPFLPHRVGGWVERKEEEEAAIGASIYLHPCPGSDSTGFAVERWGISGLGSPSAGERASASLETPLPSSTCHGRKGHFPNRPGPARPAT